MDEVGGGIREGGSEKGKKGGGVRMAICFGDACSRTPLRVPAADAQRGSSPFPDVLPAL